MPVQKIKSGRIITVTATTYVGEKGIVFYDEDTPELRLSDGVTPGGLLISGGGGGGYVLPAATTSTLGGIRVGQYLTVTSSGTLSVNTASLNIVANSFATIVTTGSNNLVAAGADTLELVAGPAISIVSSSTANPKSITIGVSSFIGNLDGGFPDTIYGGTVNIDGGSV